MEFIFELLFPIFGELLLQLFIQVLVELGLRSVAEPFKVAPNPWFAALGYLLLGCVAGGLSLLVFPRLFIASDLGRLVNLGFTPALAGLAMAALGAWRMQRGQELIRIDRFAYGYLFAISVGFIRFHFGR